MKCSEAIKIIKDTIENNEADMFNPNFFDSLSEAILGKLETIGMSPPLRSGIDHYTQDPFTWEEE